MTGQPMTLRVHQLAKGMGVTSVTTLWFLRLIGHEVTSPASKVTIEPFEMDVLVDTVVGHKHGPAPHFEIVPIPGGRFRRSTCICTEAIQEEGHPTTGPTYWVSRREERG